MYEVYVNVSLVKLKFDLKKKKTLYFILIIDLEVDTILFSPNHLHTQIYKLKNTQKQAYNFHLRSI